MNILLTNDDGYFAPGIKALVKYLMKDNNVYVVAPEHEQSGASHSVSFFFGLTYKEIKKYDYDVTCYAVDGSPADCVLFGSKYLLKDKKIDLVISGINSVMNVGSDILYSGTFGAASEATFLGLRGIAVSTMAFNDDYEYTAKWVSDNLQKLYSISSTKYTININLPFEKKEQLKGVMFSSVSYRPYEDGFKEIGVDEKTGRKLYKISGEPIPQVDKELTLDVPQVENGYISISPVKLFASDEKAINDIKKKVDIKL